MSKPLEMRITGLGGQGSILMAHIIGSAYSIEAGNQATMIQSFGPEARGAACSATLVFSEDEVLYPYIRRPDVFVVMSGEGYEMYRDELKEDGILVYEQDLVEARPKEGQKSCGIPSTRIAEELGKVIVQNIVMLGFTTAVTGIVSVDEMRRTVEHSVPKGTEGLNLKAFDRGVSWFEEEYNDGKKLPREDEEAGAAAASETEESPESEETAV